MDIYKQLLRPLLFCLDAETAHNMARAVLLRPRLCRIITGSGLLVRDERLRVDLGGGLSAPNPVGLAAGFDKDCDMINGLMGFGFGYIVAGSVMCRSRPGNPRPRMVRDPDRDALFSCMGLPSRGLDYAVRQLGRIRPGPVPLVVNINGESQEEYFRALETLQPLADALEISLFCPNRRSDAGNLLQAEAAEPFLAEVVRLKNKPIFIKIPGYITEADRLQRLELVDCIRQFPLEGITITPESRVTEGRLSIGAGTITGRPLLGQMLKVVGDVYGRVGDGRAVKASGGVSTAGGGGGGGGGGRFCRHSGRGQFGGNRDQPHL